MANTIKSYITIRNGTINNWTNSSIVLKRGELALSLENGLFSLKAGDGIHIWKDLPFLAVHSADISDLESAISASETIIRLTQKVNETTVGSITQEEKEKIESFTIENVSKWKDGYNELQEIKRKINTIRLEHPIVDSTTLGEVASYLNQVSEVFKVLENDNGERTKK